MAEPISSSTPAAPSSAPGAAAPSPDITSFERTVTDQQGHPVTDSAVPSSVELPPPKRADPPQERRGPSESQRLARVAKAEKELAEREAALDGAQKMHEFMTASPQERAVREAQNLVGRFTAQAQAHVRANADRYPLLAAYGDHAVADVIRAHELVARRTGQIASHAQICAEVEKLYAAQLEPGRRALMRSAARPAPAAAPRRGGAVTADERYRRALRFLRSR